MIFGLREAGRWTAVGEGALLVFFAIAAYWPVLSCGFIWDDNDYVENNKALESPAGLLRIWTTPTASPQYYPLVFTTFWIERRLFGLNPAGYHAINVLLHAACGVLLWRILRRLSLPVAWFVAALFVLHPVEVESVAWITERKNVLSGFFYLAAALAYLRFRPLDRESTSWQWYAASLALFVLALLSKTVTCSLPAALLLVYWWKRPRLGGRDVWPLLPMFAIGAALAYVTVWMEKHHVGAQGVDFSLTPIDRILIAGRAVCFYFGKLVLPTDLAFIYPRWSNRSDVGPSNTGVSGPCPPRHRGRLVLPAAHRQGATRRHPLLRRHAAAGPRLHRCLSDAFLVRRRSLPVSRQHRAAHADRRRRGSSQLSKPSS